MPRSPRLPFVALATVGLLLPAVGCTSDPASAPSTVAPPTTTPVARVDDGVLTIGVLTPQGSANADIGQAIRAAVTLAVDTINKAGGYHGRNVVLRPADEGVVPGGIDPAIAKLLSEQVDAIVGPASSTNALTGLREIVDSGVMACSPTASARLLDDYPDKNLFFRTIPSDSMQALAIAEAVDRTGASRATITYIDDDYGQGFADSVKAALALKGIEQQAVIPYSADNVSIKAAAGKVVAAATGVIVVIGDATSGPVMLGEVDTQERNVLPQYIVNDAMRRPTASAEPMGASLASRVRGISPVAYSSDAHFLAQLGATPADPSPYAANAFDCVNLIALAALAGNSTLPDVIASEIPSVSDSGSPCMTFVDCRDDIAAGSNINYDGPGGALTIGTDGDLAAAVFDLFGFDDTGRDVNVGTVRCTLRDCS